MVYVFYFFQLVFNLTSFKLIIKKDKDGIKKKSYSRKPKSGAGSSNKITENDFSPDSKRLAIVAKNHLRFRAATGDAFPAANVATRDDFIMAIIKEAASTYGGSVEPKLTSVLSRVIKDEETLEKLTTFVCISFLLFQMLMTL
jgi:hypothetical protein